MCESPRNRFFRVPSRVFRYNVKCLEKVIFRYSFIQKLPAKQVKSCCKVYVDRRSVARIYRFERRSDDHY